MALGKVSTDVLGCDDTIRVRFAKRADFCFLYSNGWWQLEVEYELPSEMAGMINNIRRIPDGIRLLPLFPLEKMPPSLTHEAVVPAALAYPIPFPPPVQNELFVCWLGLCPNPELPVIGRDRIRRLLSPEWADHPDNEGRFRLRYLTDESGFLAQLSIWHKGLELLPDGRTMKYSPPFHEGALELTYEVLQTTNWSGTILPKRAVLTRYGPKSKANTRDDIDPTVVAQLTVDTIEPWDGTIFTARPLPQRVSARDRRFPGMPSNAGVQYYVTNDQWMPISTPELAGLATVYRRAAVPPPPRPLWGMRLAVTAVAMAPLAVWACRRLYARVKNRLEINDPPREQA